MSGLIVCNQDLCACFSKQEMRTVGIEPVGIVRTRIFMGAEFGGDDGLM